MNKRRKILFLCLASIGSVLIIAGIKGQESRTSTAIQQNKTPQNFTEGLPVAEYRIGASTEGLSQAEAAKRQAKNARHNNSLARTTIQELPSGAQNLPIMAPWTRGLKALPVEQSAIIVTAVVKQAQAFISSDRTTVYSEFTLGVESVFKTAQERVTAGTLLVADRFGGAVSFPSGKVDAYRLGGQNYPYVDGRYLLFLKRENEEDLSIVTAYELVDGYVYPLDESDLFAFYKGAMEWVLLQHTQAAIAGRKGGQNQ